MLPAITPQTPIKVLSHRPQAAGLRDSEGSFSVLADAPQSAVPGRLAVILDATELQPALMEAVNEARNSIKADFHLLRGREGQELARQLARRVRQGIRVQILAWGRPTAAFAEAVKVARSQGLAVRIGQGPAIAEGTGSFLLVDDRLALVGAARASESAHARRGLLRLAGEAATELGRQFNHDWAASGGTPLPLPEMGRRSRFATHELASMVQIGGAGAQRKAAKALLLAAFGKARVSLAVMAGVLEDAEVIASLVAAKKRGVAVKVILGDSGRAVASLAAAGIPVRRYQAQGGPQTVSVHYAVADGETLLWGTAPWSRAGLASSGELLVAAHGGREVALLQASFTHDWQMAVPASAPRGLARLKAEAQPLIQELSRLVGQYSPVAPARSLMNTKVGVVRVGKKIKWVAERP